MAAEGLRVEGLRAGYGSIEIVHGVSFTADPGEIVAVLGSNGAGKTTTLGALSGVVKRSADVISLGGRPLARRPETVAGAGLAHVPQGRRMFGELTVRENLLAATLHQRRQATASALERIYSLVPRLAELERRRAGVLSGGEQQLVAIGRALAARPQALLIDELSLGLAPKVVNDFEEVLRGLARDGLAIVMVEQYATFALRVASQVLVMERGHLIFTGKPDEFGERDLLRATYLGSPTSAGSEKST